MQVFITVLDDNDCIPMFPQPSYTWTISEGSLPGQAFIDVAASDCDLTTNAEIDYFVDSVGNTGGKNRVQLFNNIIIYACYVGAFEATAEGPPVCITDHPSACLSRTVLTIAFHGYSHHYGSSDIPIDDNR